MVIDKNIISNFSNKALERMFGKDVKPGTKKTISEKKNAFNKAFFEQAKRSNRKRKPKWERKKVRLGGKNAKRI